MSSFGHLFTDDTCRADGVSESRIRPYRILLVDDEPNVLHALRRTFHRENYIIDTAANGGEGLLLLDKTEFHVIISDFKMPGMNGGEFLRRARTAHPDTIRIMLTGHADVDAVMGAVKEGSVYRFILKPWNDDDLRITVGLALEQYELKSKNRDLKRQDRDKEKQIELLSKMVVTNRSQLAIMLHKRGLLNDRQVRELHKLQSVRKQPMIQLLTEKSWIAEKTIRDILVQDFLVEEVQLREFRPDPQALQLVPKSFCLRQWVLPLRLQGRRILLAVADPLDAGLLEDLRFVTGLEVETVIAPSGELSESINSAYGVQDVSEFDPLEAWAHSDDPLESVEIILDEEEDESLEALLHSSEEPPAIRLVNAIIIEAVRLGVSDIHIQPRAKSVVVRYRIDGVLSDKIHIPNHLHASLVSRIKIMAELDISERRRPQDGRITVKTPMRIVDLRLSTLPTISGEKVVMRVLDRNASVHRIDDLGFGPEELRRVKTMVRRPQGIILATGPTGSGKTTTLYSLLQHDADPGKNYVTIEDPVEFFLDSANQVHVRERIGLNFPKVLRAILRQDPDVVLIGEIRDFETAEVAFHAAMTGHLVYSTLHTNSAASTVARLFDLGLKPFVVASALEGIIAQRLVRRVCPDCRTETEADSELLEALGPLFDPERTRTWQGRGCPTCHGTGYRGRLGIYEVLTPDDRLRELISDAGSVMEIERLVRERSRSSLLADARSKVDQGLTTDREILRVLGPQADA